MRKQSKLLSIILVILFIPMTVGGCWDRRELDTLAIIAGAAIDRVEEKDKIQLTLQVMKPGDLKGAQGGGGGAAQEPFQTLQGTGTSVVKIVNKISQESSRQPYWPHSQVIIVSEEVAKAGMSKHLDFFVRNSEPRRLAYILISKDPAKAILEQKATQEKIPALGLSNTLENLPLSSRAMKTTVFEFAERLLSKTTAPIVPLVKLVGEGNDRQAVITGTAVFKRERLVGELDGVESRGLLWVINKVERGFISVGCSDSKEDVDLEIIRADSKITPEIVDGSMRMLIKIREEGNLAAQLCPEDFTKLPAWKELEEKQRTAIHKEITAALQKAKVLNTDIFGFSSAIYKKYPAIWGEMEKEWDDIFPKLEVIVTVEAKLRRSGETSMPLTPK